MISKSGHIKCDGCGKFISYNDLGPDGNASHYCILDDTEFSRETFESFCPKCNKERIDAKSTQ